MDNGRSTEFIRRRDYSDKSQCYECRQYGHLSYCCNNNTLGPRKPPPKKLKIRKHMKKCGNQEKYDTNIFEISTDKASSVKSKCDSDKSWSMKSKFDSDNDEEVSWEEPDTLSAVIALEV